MKSKYLTPAICLIILGVLPIFGFPIFMAAFLVPGLLVLIVVLITSREKYGYFTAKKDDVKMEKIFEAAEREMEHDRGKKIEGGMKLEKMLSASEKEIESNFGKRKKK